MTTNKMREELADVARRLAEKANECCHRSDGYEEDMQAAILAALLAASEAATRRALPDGFVAVPVEDAKNAERYKWLRDGGNESIGVIRGADAMDYGSSGVIGTFEDWLDSYYLDHAIDAAMLQAAPRGEAEHCRYPACECPFDAPADPNWCARGLPKNAPATVATEDGTRDEPLTCDDCGAVTPDPWHSSKGSRRHYHRCDACHAKAVAKGGGVDVEKVMALVEEYGEQCEAAGYLDRSGSQDASKKLHDTAYQTAVKIRALLSASPAVVGGAPAIANQEPQDGR